MKQVGGECPLQGIMPTGKGTPGQEARVFLAFHVLLPLDKGKKCIYALRESSKAWQVIWVFPDGDIIEAIKALLGNPSYAKQIVWRPRRVFTDASKTKRVFSEMWTGLWWNELQVRCLA